MPGIAQNQVPFLRELYAFQAFSDQEMMKVAEVAEIIELAEEAQLIVPANIEAPFYMIISGRVHIAQDRGGGVILKDPYHYKPGQFFGADWVLYNKNRRLIATAMNPVKLLTIDAANLKILLQTMPSLKKGLLFAQQMYQWLHSKAFEWIADDELVYLIARKHPVFLLIRLLPPSLWILFALLLFILSATLTASSVKMVLLWLGIPVMVFAFLWAIWRIIDWGNDYYVVTDQRVAWIEQILGIYESRREAFLSSIRNKSITTANWFERRFGYGDILMTVYAGQIVFKNIPDPYNVDRLIDFLMGRTDLKVKKQNVQETQKLILEKIKHVDKILQEEVEPLPPPALPATKIKRPNLPTWKDILAFFRIETRFQQGEVITYRTHLIFLLIKLILPALTQVGALILAVILIQGKLQGNPLYPSPLVTILLAITLSLFAFLWSVYHFSDWRNDIYQITPDKILDKDHKPFQEEHIVQAFLNDILSMEIERENLFEIFLNYGTVIINTGTEQRLTFDNIPNPTMALQDIYSRLYQLKRQQELADMRKQADQSALLLATYHHYEESLRRRRTGTTQSARDSSGKG
jgi:hypothetical protein